MSPWHSQTLTRRAEQSRHSPFLGSATLGHLFHTEMPTVATHTHPGRHSEAEGGPNNVDVKSTPGIPVRAQLEEIPPTVTPPNQNFLQRESIWEVSGKTTEAWTFCLFVFLFLPTVNLW